MARFPEAPFRLVVGGGTGAALSNPKVERLVAAARAARGDIFFVSDSNVRVEPGDVAATVAAFDDPAVGCVSNVFTGSGARSFGAVDREPSPPHVRPARHGPRRGRRRGRASWASPWR